MNRPQLVEIIRECISEILFEGRKICAWCEKDMGHLDDKPGDSHGICPDCLEKQRKEIEDLKKKKLPYSAQ